MSDYWRRFARSEVLQSRHQAAFLQLRETVGLMEQMIARTGGHMDTFQGEIYDALARRREALSADISEIERLWRAELDEAQASTPVWPPYREPKRRQPRYPATRPQRQPDPPQEPSQQPKQRIWMDRVETETPPRAIDFAPVEPIIPISEPREEEPSPTHLLTDEADRRERAILSWAPWARRNRRRRMRLYEGFGGR